MYLPAYLCSEMYQSIFPNYLPVPLRRQYLIDLKLYVLGHPPTLVFWIENNQACLFLVQLNNIGTHPDKFPVSLKHLTWFLMAVWL